MSKQRVEFEFSARDNASQSFDRVREAAIRTSKAIIEEANKQNLSAKESLKYLEDQIKLRTQSNNADSQNKRVAIDDRYSAIQSNDANLRNQRLEEGKKLREMITSGASQTDIDNQRDKLNSIRQGSGLSESELRNRKTKDVTELAAQTRERTAETTVLKEILEAIKRASKEEINNENRNFREEERNADENANIVGESISRASDKEYTDKEFQDLAQKIKSENSKGSSLTDSRIGRSEQSEDINKSLQGVQRVAGQHDVVSAGTTAMGIMSSNPILMAIGAIIGVGAMALNIRAEREQAASLLAAQTRGSAEGIVNSGVGSTNLGKFGALDLNVTRNQFLQQYAPQTNRARGTSDGYYSATMANIALDKGQGLDSGSANAMSRLARVTKDATDSVEVFTKIIGGSGKDISKVRYAEIAQLSTAFLESQFQKTGNADVGQLGGIMTFMNEMRNGDSDMNKRYGMDTYRFNVAGQLNAGLSAQGSPEADGINMMVLRKLHPEMTLTQLRNEQDKGLGSKGYLEGVFNFIKNTNGSQSDMELMIGGAFKGRTSNQTNIDFAKRIKEGADISTISREFAAANIDLMGDAKRASSKSAMQVEFSKEAMNDIMSGIGKEVSSLISTLGSLAVKLDHLGNKLDHLGESFLGKGVMDFVKDPYKLGVSTRKALIQKGAELGARYNPF